MNDSDSTNILPRTVRMIDLLKPSPVPEIWLFRSIQSSLSGSPKFPFLSLPAELRDEVCRHCDTPTLFSLSHTAKEPRFHAHKVWFSERHSWFIVQPRSFIQSWQNVANATGQPDAVTAPCLLAASHVTRIRIGGSPFDLANYGDRKLFYDVGIWTSILKYFPKLRQIVIPMHLAEFRMPSEAWPILQIFAEHCQIYLLMKSPECETLWQAFPKERRIVRGKGINDIVCEYVVLPPFTGPVSRFTRLVYERVTLQRKLHTGFVRGMEPKPGRVAVTSNWDSPGLAVSPLELCRIEWGMRRTEKRVDFSLKFLKQLEEDPMFEYRNNSAESPIYRLLEAFMDYNDGVSHVKAIGPKP